MTTSSSRPAVATSHRQATRDATSPEPQWHEKLRDGTRVLIRPIHASDVELERRFIEALSPESRRLRFLGQVGTPSPALLAQLTNPDPRLDAAFVALIAEGASKREIGVARFSAQPDGRRCECAVTVSEDWRNRGLATVLMQHLIEVARGRGIQTMYSVDAAENPAMRDLAAHLGFARRRDPENAAQVLHTLDLTTATV
ncbi:MAG: N-acetyltransferase [Proteobacteria bacterium]|nr:N-acetyltransferase [Pseudomonadota bacterium]